MSSIQIDGKLEVAVAKENTWKDSIVCAWGDTVIARAVIQPMFTALGDG